MAYFFQVCTDGCSCHPTVCARDVFGQHYLWYGPLIGNDVRRYRYGVPATAQISIDEAKEVVRITARTFPPAEVVKYSFDHSVAHVSGVSRRKGRLAFSVKNDGKVPGDYPPAKFDYVTYVLQVRVATRL